MVITCKFLTKPVLLPLIKSKQNSLYIHCVNRVKGDIIMTKVRIILTFLLVQILILIPQTITAQVLEQDSLALVALYNSTVVLIGQIIQTG